MKHKIFPIEIKKKTKTGGQIIISTASPDREGDRIFSSGARVENYLNNPVVLWGHNSRDPWAVIGKTTSLIIEPDQIIAEFELRPPANEHDPVNIVNLLWEGEWIKTASIGFNPHGEIKTNQSGLDFLEWELLEWSLVPIPANQDALRLAVKAFGTTQKMEFPKKEYKLMEIIKRMTDLLENAYAIE